MTTTLTAPQPSLDERLADAKKELENAEQALGVVVYDGGDESAARKRAADAQAAVDALRLALAEGQRRADDAAAAEQERATAIVRWRYLSWYAEYIQRIKPVIELRVQLATVEARVMALDTPVTAAAAPDTRTLERWVAEEIDAGRLPELDKLPRRSAGGQYVVQGTRPERADDGDLTAADCAEWAKRLAPVVARAAKPIGNAASPANLPWQQQAA